MIDTPQSIAAGRIKTEGDTVSRINTATTIAVGFTPATISIIGDNMLVWQQQTINAAMSGNDKLDYRSETHVLGACHTNAAWIGNVSED